MAASIAIPLMFVGCGLLLLVALTCAWQWHRAEQRATDREADCQRWQEMFADQVAERKLATGQVAQLGLFVAQVTTGQTSLPAPPPPEPAGRFEKVTLASLVGDAAARQAWLDSTEVPVVPVEELFEPTGPAPALAPPRSMVTSVPAAPPRPAPVSLPQTLTDEELQAAWQAHEELELPWDELAASLDVSVLVLRQEVDTWLSRGVQSAATGRR